MIFCFCDQYVSSPYVDTVKYDSEWIDMHNEFEENNVIQFLE